MSQIMTLLRYRLGMSIAGAIIMVASVLMGHAIQEDIAALGVDAYAQQTGLGGWLKFMLFAFGFPLGLAVSAIGALLGTGEAPRGVFWRGLVLVLLVMASVLVPLMCGRQLSPAFFGVGGYSILGLVVIATWLWGSHRARIPCGNRLAADLQGAGYLCFAMAAWNLCGVGGMPSFALEPKRMLALESLGFAVGQMKTVMALLVLGWLFTVLGYRKALDRS